MTLKELQAKRASLAKQIRDLADRQDKWSAEDRAEYAKLNAAYDENLKILNEEVEKAKREDAERAAMNTRLQEMESFQDYSPAQQQRVPPGRDSGNVQQGPLLAGGNDRSLAIQGWFISNSRFGQEDLRPQHVEAAKRVGIQLGTPHLILNLAPTTELDRMQASRRGPAYNVMKAGDPLTGGVLIGTTMIASIEQAMLDYSGVLQVASIIRTNTGEPLMWPTIDDTSGTGTLVGESADAGTATDPTFGQVIWHAFDYTTGVLRVSRTLMQDAPINMEAELGQLLGVRLGRKQNTDYTTGTGGGIRPKGIVTCAALGVTAASTTGIVFDEIIDLEHSIDPSRRNMPGVGYMFHDSILQHLRKLKDGNGQYLWSNGTQAGQADRINGRSYAINQAMASTIAASAKTVLFGQLSMYKVRQVNQLVIQRLVERYAEYNQDAFIGYMRADGNLLNAGDNPIKYLTH